MKLIVEAGSSKTDFAILNDRLELIEKRQFNGMNPVTDVEIKTKLQAAFDEIRTLPIDSLHWYGSGCINLEVNDNFKNEILKINPELKKIEIYDDLLGAARGLWQDKSGLIAILGTGSNIGYYNGDSITDRVKSCGYLLGDEGSGFRIGQIIYLDYIRGRWSEDETTLFQALYGFSKDEAVSRLYARRDPRSYLASFSTFITNLGEEQKMHILESVFVQFIQNMALPLCTKTTNQIAFVGSIAFHFQNELSEILQKFNILAASFEKSPLEGLIKYHHGKGN